MTVKIKYLEDVRWRWSEREKLRWYEKLREIQRIEIELNTKEFRRAIND